MSSPPPHTIIQNHVFFPHNSKPFNFNLPKLVAQHYPSLRGVCTAFHMYTLKNLFIFILFDLARFLVTFDLFLVKCN